MAVEFLKSLDEFKLKYVVIMARYQDKWIYCRRQDRNTYEIPGGHIENGETKEEAASRELFEETGALKFNLQFVTYYKYSSYGALFIAYIEELGQLPNFEIKEIIFDSGMPMQLTYPFIQPKLFTYVNKFGFIKYKTEKEKMLAGALYKVDDELRSLHLNSLALTQEYNTSDPTNLNKRNTILKKLLGHIGKNCYIEPSIKCDYGSNIRIGDNFYANFDCIFLDVNTITFGDNVFVAPRCSFFTAGHPIDSEVRNENLEYGYPIIVGSNVWFGGGVIVNPGVTIGDNVVIGSGSVVTKDIPSNVVAAGNPCRIIRSITEEDKKYWQSQK